MKYGSSSGTSFVYQVFRSATPECKEPRRFLPGIVIILREFEELSILEIAERLRYTVRTVTTHLFRGRSMPLAAVRKSLTAIPKG
jgi:Sigma-70, region 4